MRRLYSTSRYSRSSSERPFLKNQKKTGVNYVFNVFIEIDEKEKLTTDVFYYNEEKHYLSFHLPYNYNDNWETISNVKCEITVDRPMIYISAKTINESEL